MKQPKKIIILALLLIFILSCNLPGKDTSEPPLTPAPGNKPVEQPLTPPAEEEGATHAKALDLKREDIYARSFSEYPNIDVKIPAKFAGGYTLPINTGQVQGMDMVTLSPEQEAMLGQNGFVVAQPVPGEYREFYQIYENIRYYDNQPAFITTDSVFHVYHLLFDKMLRDLERESFIPTLEQLTSIMLKASQDQYQTLKGTALEEAALRNVAYFGVAAQLLGLSDPIPPEAAALVKDEMALIDGASGPGESPIWQISDKPLIEDYGQYIPRGHYTRSEVLKKYFRSMMWYGRLTFRLRDPLETRRALLVVSALRSAKADDGTPAVQLWQNIYEPTAFIVGKADDLSYTEYGAISDAVFGKNADIKTFADDEKLAVFNATAKKLPAPQVNSMWVWIWEDRGEATQGFRFMGQRFTLDAYVFGQVMWRKVGTDDKPRDLPKALDFFAAMGSEEAYNILIEMGEDQYKNYTDQMEKARRELATLEVDSWTQNVYWSWLYAFQPLIAPKGEQYPAFMRTQAWTRKDLHTSLGSFTELKHDTVLYAKQVMAEMGGGGPDTPPLGWVEPNPEAYARMLALAQMTSDGLVSRGLNPTVLPVFTDLIDLLKFLQSVSERELAGQKLTDEEYWRIAWYGGTLEHFTLMAADPEEGQGNPILEDQKAALVTDIATGINNRVLQEGSGQPTPIYVVLPDEPYRVAIGAVYTYYEFIGSSDKRMTDEEWQQMVEKGSNPPAPDWTSMFIAP